MEKKAVKIISYSDLHLEFGTDFRPPTDSDADVMILAGDIITCRDYTPLSYFLQDWHKPVLYVMGRLQRLVGSTPISEWHCCTNME